MHTILVGLIGPWGHCSRIAVWLPRSCLFDLALAFNTNNCFILNIWCTTTTFGRLVENLGANCMVIAKSRAMFAPAVDATELAILIIKIQRSQTLGTLVYLYFYPKIYTYFGQLSFSYCMATKVLTAAPSCCRLPASFRLGGFPTGLPADVQ